MNRVVKGIISFAVATAIVFGGFVLGGNFQEPITAEASTNTWSGRTPKYIFLFIGDGMSYTQINAANDYLGAVEYEGKQVASQNLSFTTFPVTGSATTFDSTSFCPDSASTATSIATGHKTLSGVINMDEQKQVAYETISEKLKEQLGYKIGVVTSVPIDHATPAAFYAHQPSRGNVYEIALEMIESDFDYFAGGGFQAPTGKNKDKANIVDLAAEAGYTIADSKEEILAISSASDKVIAIAPDAIASALPYEIDREAGDLSLADYTRKGIEMLYNKTGFFMMVEGGKIDWACHANDASASIQDTVAFDEAIQEAVKFYNKYPKDTLIIVTGDHETGGLAVGYAGTGYSTYLTMLEEQTMSYEAYDAQVAKYRADKTSFASAMKDVKENFGLMVSTDLAAADAPLFVLTEYELENLKKAYEMSMFEKADREYTEADKLLYGSYEPFSVAVTHVLNNKAGIGWTSYSHTAVPVPVFAQGTGATIFIGFYDNTEVFLKLQAITKVD